MPLLKPTYPVHAPPTATRPGMIARQVKRASLAWAGLSMLLAAAALAQPRAELTGFLRQSREGGALGLSLEFSRPVRARTNDQLLQKGYYYVDFFGVAGPAEQADWPTADAGLRHIRRLYYPEPGVLRFILYAQPGRAPVPLAEAPRA